MVNVCEARRVLTRACSLLQALDLDDRRNGWACGLLKARSRVLALSALTMLSGRERSRYGWRETVSALMCVEHHSFRAVCLTSI